MHYALVFAGLPVLFRFASQPRLRLPVKRRDIERRDAHDQQQELFLMGASRLVDDQIFWPSFLGDHHFAGRRRDARRTFALVLLLSGACLSHNGIKVWDTLAIGEYLNEIEPAALLLPVDRAKRTRCRSISGEMHSGFGPMRSALPMNLKGDFPNFKVWTRAQADIDRITMIWRECLDLYGGPFLLGERSMADAMYAPVVTRFLTYHVKLDDICSAYCRTIMAMPEMIEWIGAAKQEPENVEELEVEF